MVIVWKRWQFCYVCDTRTKNPIIDGGTHCNTCKEERDVIERYVCNCCDDICEPIELYEYDQLRIYELKKQLIAELKQKKELDKLYKQNTIELNDYFAYW